MKQKKVHGIAIILCIRCERKENNIEKYIGKIGVYEEQYCKGLLEWNKWKIICLEMCA